MVHLVAGNTVHSLFYLLGSELLEHACTDRMNGKETGIKGEEIHHLKGQAKIIGNKTP